MEKKKKFVHSKYVCTFSFCRYYDMDFIAPFFIHLYTFRWACSVAFHNNNNNNNKRPMCSLADRTKRFKMQIRNNSFYLPCGMAIVCSGKQSLTHSQCSQSVIFRSLCFTVVDNIVLVCCCCAFR